jgi:protein-tyrosine kinase
MRSSVARRLDAMCAALDPDVVLFDLPPLLGRDDATGFLPQVDGILLIADATRTTAAQIAECEALFKGSTRLFGVVLNRAADAAGRGGADARG